MMGFNNFQMSAYLERRESELCHSLPQIKVFQNQLSLGNPRKVEQGILRGSKLCLTRDFSL
jgi:hypothetical protein